VQGRIVDTTPQEQVENRCRSRRRGGRPTRFTFELGVELLGGLDEDLSRRQIATRNGIGLRTLCEWIRRGRRGETLFAWFAQCWDQQERVRRRIRFAAKTAVETENARRRYRKFAESREAWWKERLGPRLFWERRLQWLADRGMHDAYDRTVARLESEGFRVVSG
jgi:hypothetical protein